ncbi:hypothetical protein Bca101_061645 [Brassica carinata]
MAFAPILRRASAAKNLFSLSSTVVSSHSVRSLQTGASGDDPCGVCHSDLHVMKGEIPFSSPCVIIGHEITGEVVEHGPLTDHKIIKRAKGTLYDGETRLFLRHDDSPVYMYSMGGCAVFTAYGATAHAAEIRPGDSIAVIGIGGVGCSCLQIARAFGASDIIAVDVQDDKLQNALTLGATHIVNAAKENAVDRIRVGWCVDVAVEALGKPQTFMQCTLSVKDGGKAVMIGLSQAGSVGEIDINRLVKRKIKVIGSYGGRARQDLPEVVKLAESGIQV